ncbi:hypothetical protein [Micromonospora globbae]|uniref:hypothetical protein n=1 Tax=Micromonospora globbae TaxID=1894969 RepID=UPI00379D2F74
MIITPLTCAAREVIDVARRWDAWFEQGHLVVRRRRLLPWLKADVRRIPLASVVDIGSPTATDHAKRRAHLTIQDPSASNHTATIPVRFTPEQWEHAGWFVRQRQAPRVEPSRRGEPPSEPPPPPCPATDVRVSPQSRRQAASTTAAQAHLSAEAATTPSHRAAAASATPVMRAGDGKRSVWLWRQDDEIHASLVPVGHATPRKLSPANVAKLLLADPARAMPAIRALTGIADSEQALARLRSWRRSDRVVVNLSASDLAGRRVTEALQKPGRSNPDGTVRTVSGGLPSLNKRRR